MTKQSLEWLEVLGHLTSDHNAICFHRVYYTALGFPGGAVLKKLPATAGDTSLIPGSGRFPGVGSGSPLQYSCPEISMDRGACHGPSCAASSGCVLTHTWVLPGLRGCHTLFLCVNGSSSFSHFHTSTYSGCFRFYGYFCLHCFFRLDYSFEAEASEQNHQIQKYEWIYSAS